MDGVASKKFDYELDWNIGHVLNRVAREDSKLWQDEDLLSQTLTYLEENHDDWWSRLLDNIKPGRKGIGDEGVIKMAEIAAENKELAGYDGLTGLLNRRALDERMLSTWAHYRRDTIENGFTVAFVDVDFFKDVNDGHSHQAGDELIVEIANALTSNLRLEDLVARYGGDEFVIILPNGKLDEQEMKETIRLRIEAVDTRLREYRASHSLSKWRGVVSEGETENLSVGICYVGEGGGHQFQNPSEVMYAADLELYRNKNIRHANQEN